MTDRTSFDDRGAPDANPVPLPRHHSDRGQHEMDRLDSSPSEKARSLSHLPSNAERRKVSVVDSNEDKSGFPRKSTQFSHRASTRQSAEFDRRVDGPFARPSLSMARRASQQTSIHAPEAWDTTPQSTTELAPTPSLPQMAPTRAFEPEPPPLNYDLWCRKWWILGFWTLVVFDSVVCPVALYFGLWYGLTREQMSANTVFSIVTAAVGGMSIFEYFLRLWKLVKKTSTCRVIGAKWWHGDFFHWNFTIGWLIIMVELIVGTVQEHPPPRLIAMVVPTMLYVFAVELLVLDVLRYFAYPAPIRISSLPKGTQVRPGIYSMIEDVIAVDGSGGTEYRQALNRRYEASHVFRAMLRRLGLFWSVGSMLMATVCTILIFTIPEDPAYVVGWTAPFVWAGVWAWATIWYVKRKLREEETAWAEEIAEKALEA